jgi:hypothetical protein
MMGVRIFQAALQKPVPTNSTVNSNDPHYGFAILDEVKVQLACERYIAMHRSVPASVDDLAEAGLSSEFYFDPWKRRYRIRLLPGDVLLVQTTGASGLDSISDEWAESVRNRLEPPFQFAGDNLILVKKLSRVKE